MIGITKLYCGQVTPGDTLRYGRKSKELPANLLQFASDKKPVVVWNTTRTCNLRCIHCYSDSDNKKYSGELTTEQGEAFIRDLGKFGAPVLLFSGGEPLLREDLFHLGELAKTLGIRPVISTNGTLITEEAAKKIRKTGFEYVGISLDGIGAVNDKFRGKEGAFERAREGYRNCIKAGQKVGLRLTLTKHNVGELPEIFEFIEEEKIERACFYHLVYSGRGRGMKESDLSLVETRKAIDFILEKTKELHARGLNKDILTVDNHADGVYLYLKLKKEDPKRAEEVLQLLRWNGGNSSGIGIGCVDTQGNVHADQFLGITFGNVKERPFSEIWADIRNPVMAGLKDRRKLLKGRCGKCQWQDICNGNFRARALAVYNDLWAEDPACYLTDEEIGMA
ncbi:MAG: radical SAM protein [Candidatus Omnitrophica bacterium]|nr:radical SAM protein [Candidatus Omnitrophota bacterium]